MEYPKFLASSINPQELGLTVKGVLVLLVPIILTLAGAANWSIGEGELQSIIDATVEVVIAVTTAISAIMILAGLIRKVLVALGWIKVK